MYERELAQKFPILFAISTCPRCKRMKSFLEENKIQTLVVDVDLLLPAEKRRQLDFLSQVNPSLSMPTLVVGDLAVIGEDYEGVKEALQLS